MAQRERDSRGSAVSEYAAVTMAAVTLAFSLLAVLTFKNRAEPIDAGMRAFESVVWPLIQRLIDLVSGR